MQEMQETHIRSLGQEDPLEKGRATHSSFLAWEMPWMDRGAWWIPGHRITESDTTEQPSTHTRIYNLIPPGISSPRRGFAASIGGIIDGLPHPAFLVHQPSFTGADATHSTL